MKPSSVPVHELKYGKMANENELLRQFADRTHYDILLDHTVRVKRDDGTTLCVLLKNALSRQAGGAMYRAIRDKVAWTNNRGTASGQTSRGNLKQDGTISRTTRTEKSVQSSIMGFFDRNPRFPYCRQTAFAEQYPQAFAACHPALVEASRLFALHAPERYAAQRAVCDRTHPDFLIPRTVFTTVTLNRNFRTGFHRDAGDFADGFGVMSYYRGGRFNGGHLVFPAYRVALKLDSLDLVLFDPHELHGNTEIVPLRADADYERITCVHYYRENMHYCGSAAEELEHARAHDPRTGKRKMHAKPQSSSEKEAD